ncbi:unnamed protein product [Ascophyllum nodosum]
MIQLSGLAVIVLLRGCRGVVGTTVQIPSPFELGTADDHKMCTGIATVFESSGASPAKRSRLQLRGGSDAKSSLPCTASILGWRAPAEAEADAQEGRRRMEGRLEEVVDVGDPAERDALRKVSNDLRQARDNRLEREAVECGVWRVGEGGKSEDGSEGGGILLAMGMAKGDPTRKVLSPKPKRLWLEVVEGFVGGMSLASASLLPMFHLLRALFGLSMLFYGQEFATLAFHIVVFRLSGSKKAAQSINELVAYYKKARQVMVKAATDVRATKDLVARNDKLKANREAMMMEKKRLLEDGRVTAEEARAFIDKYRLEIEEIAREQEVLATASSSLLAIKGALSLKQMSGSLRSLYSAVVTSITASTFKKAGQLTLALTCGGLIKKTLLDLLGPVIDPIGYQIELETYIANIMRGRANLYVNLAGYATSALMFFHFFVDPRQALTITFVLLGARVVTDYIVEALNPVRWRFGVSKKIENMPLSAVIYLFMATLGFAFHQNMGVIGDYVCMPFIAFLKLLNRMLNRFQISTISYFS